MTLPASPRAHASVTLPHAALPPSPRPSLLPSPAVVNIKAKTHEKVDSLGENRSIAAEAVVLLLKA